MKYLACAEFQEGSTTVCTNEVWVDAPSTIPVLSVGDAALFGGLIFIAQLIAFLFRFLRKDAEKH